MSKFFTRYWNNINLGIKKMFIKSNFKNLHKNYKFCLISVQLIASIFTCHVHGYCRSFIKYEFFYYSAKMWIKFLCDTKTRKFYTPVDLLIVSQEVQKHKRKQNKTRYTRWHWIMIFSIFKTKICNTIILCGS